MHTTDNTYYFTLDGHPGTMRRGARMGLFETSITNAKHEIVSVAYSEVLRSATMISYPEYQQLLKNIKLRIVSTAAHRGQDA